MLSIFFGSYLLYNNDYINSSIIIVSSVFLIVSHHIFAYFFKLYKKVWQYASVNELTEIFKAVSFSILIVGILQILVFGALFTRTLILTWMLHILLLGASRFAWRILRDHYMFPNENKNKKRTLLIGAGSAGRMVVRQITMRGSDSELQPVAFVDDDIKKMNLEILGVPVVGQVKDIEELVQEYEIEHIVIAIPSLQRGEVQKIYQECQKTKIHTQIMPMMEDILNGRVSVSQFREVQIEDLLGRETVELDTSSVSSYVAYKIVMVTGAGGSIGSEICRQVVKFHPNKIILLGHGENSIYDIEMDLRQRELTCEIVTEISDIKDKLKIDAIMKRHQPDVIFHAAAHKHVPLMERNPEEAVKNNVVGTKNVAEVASDNNVKTFVMISSDKAVNPTSVMGATKRVAEMVVQHMDTISETNFVSVRFGNVLGSRGSVVPLFKKQIQQGGPVTVTDPKMTRYFMTIPEASRLVIQAGALARGGEIFVLDMGKPVNITDLAKNVIELSGHTVEEIGIKYTGMRPGEKMYEELLGDEEVHNEQVYPQIYIGKTLPVDVNLITELINDVNSQDKETLKAHIFDTADLRRRTVTKVNFNQ
ncbi:nucleoside-diphosphate sugar epimerase/dehydratase [Sinobaca qinghaiensis]